MKKLKIYLAAAWGRREEMKAVATELEAMDGIEITSRWLQERKRIIPGSHTDAFRSRRAQEDVADVRRADVLVRFTDDLSKPTVPSRLATGSRMFEMGVAYERKMPVVVVGGFQPIFDYLPKIVHVRTLDELRVYLSGRKVFRKRGQ
jgi:hypothetical protein